MSQTKAQLIDPVDGSIVNADINASAAIAGSKISPDFGSQNIVTTGGLTVDTTTLHVDTSNNRVGIGLTNPSSPLEISSATNPVIKATSSDSSVGASFTAQGGSSNDSQLTLSSGTTAKYTILRDGSQQDDLRIYDSANALDIIRYRHGSYLHFGVNGSERLRIDSSGRILIGHSSARANVGQIGDPKIQHEGLNSDDSSVSIIRNNASNFAASLIFGKSRGTSVGSNTAVNDGDQLGTIRFAAADGTDVNSEAAFIQGRINGTPGSNDTPGKLFFATTADGSDSATERMVIDSSGRVGIGTTSPSYNLEVKGSGQQVLLVGSTNAGGAFLTLDGDSNGDGAGTDYSSIGHNTSGNLVIHADNPSGNAVLMFKTGDSNEKMRLDDSGRLLLAATSGTARFHIKGSGGDGIKIENSGGTNAATIDLKNTLTNYVKEYRLAVAGSDGLYGTAKALFVRDQTAGVNRFEIQDGGDVKVSTGNLIIGTSGKCIDFATNTENESGAGSSYGTILDDYEEGSWTPTFDAPNQSSTTFGINHQYGYYTKIGNLVHVTCYLQGFADQNASGGSNDGIVITGLPFTVAALPNTSNVRHAASLALGSRYRLLVDDLVIHAFGNQNVAKLMVPSNGQVMEPMKSNQMTARSGTNEVYFAGSYRVHA